MPKETISAMFSSLSSAEQAATELRGKGFRVEISHPDADRSDREDGFRDDRAAMLPMTSNLGIGSGYNTAGSAYAGAMVFGDADTLSDNGTSGRRFQLEAYVTQKDRSSAAKVIEDLGGDLVD